MVDLLVVDDEAGVREGLSEFLRSEGFSLEDAADEEEALSKAKAFQPGVILSDLVLSNGNGISLFERVKKAEGAFRPSCILMTGHASLESSIEAIRAGVDDYLLKPIDLGELSQAVRAGLSRAREANFNAVLPAAGPDLRELSAPLTVLRAYLDMFGEGRFGPMTQVQESKWAVVRKQMAQVVRAMRGIQSPEKRQKNPGLKGLIDPQALLREVQQEFFLDFERKGVHVVFDRPGTGLGMVNCEKPKALALLESCFGTALGIAKFGMTLRISWLEPGTDLALRLSLAGGEGQAPAMEDWMDPGHEADALHSAGLELKCHGPEFWQLNFRERRVGRYS